MNDKSHPLPAWVRTTDHPLIIRTCNGTSNTMSFEAASPYLLGEHRDLFLAALRQDISAFNVEKARPIFRTILPDEGVIAPETCTPYVDANALGYYLKNVLPIVFVRTAKGELLPNTRVALKYLRENARQFSTVLDTIEHYAARIFKPEAYARFHPSYSRLFTDVAQPYSAFSNAHMAMGAGCYVMTPPGVSTLLGPPTNQKPLLPLHTGMMESEWHHSELFLTFDCPRFDERVLLIEPDSVIAQFHFVANQAHDETEVIFSSEDQGADPAYRARSIEVGLDLVEHDKGIVISEVTGVKSLSVSCPHCWVSITAAAEGGVPEDHRQVQDFYQGYKVLRAEYRRASKARASGNNQPSHDQHT